MSKNRQELLNKKFYSEPTPPFTGMRTTPGFILDVIINLDYERNDRSIIVLQKCVETLFIKVTEGTVATRAIINYFDVLTAIMYGLRAKFRDVYLI